MSEQTDAVELWTIHMLLDFFFHPQLKMLLGNSGIKFEVEGGEGSPGADTYIPWHRKIAILQHFSETFRKMLYFGEIPKKFGQN